MTVHCAFFNKINFPCGCFVQFRYAKIWKAVFVLTFCVNVANAQGKKEQIELLNRQVDSIFSFVEVLKKQIDSIETASFTQMDRIHDQQKIISEFKTELAEKNAEIKTRDDVNQNNLDSINRLSNRLGEISMQRVTPEEAYEIVEFVNTFYNSLELSYEENERHSSKGDVFFDKKKFFSCLSPDATYSMERVEKLTGFGHDQTQIQLNTIRDIIIGTNDIIVLAEVHYAFNHVGYVKVLETLNITDVYGLKVSSWNDLVILEIDMFLEDFTEEDFYALFKL